MNGLKNLTFKFMPAIIIAALTAVFCYLNWDLLTQSGMRAAFIAVSAVTLASIWLMVWGRLSLNANIVLVLLILALEIGKAASMPDGLRPLVDFWAYPAAAWPKGVWWFVYDIAAVIFIGLAAIGHALATKNETE